MKKLTFLLLLAMVSASGMAQKITIDGITYKIEKNSATVWDSDKNIERAEIKSEVEYKGVRYPVTKISSAHGLVVMIGPFGGREKLKYVSIPNSVIKIGDWAFHGCKSLTSIVIPNSVTSIGALAFGDCPELSDVVVPDKRVLKTGGTAKIFYNSLSLSKVTCQNGSFPYHILSELPEECTFMLEQKTKQQQVQYTQTVQQPVIFAPQEGIIKQDESKAPSSDVDINLPQNAAINENTFAVIFANENYQEEVKVEYALNDGEMFSQYCHKVLGLPEDNIHLRKDATLNNMRKEIEWITKVAQAYDGNARVIVYYAGHGIPDEKSGTSYLLPVDGSGSSLFTGYSLASLYKTLGELPVQDVMVFMDACFSGAKRGEGMLASARGVAIKAKPEAPKGKMIVFSAAQGDETAYPLTEKGHGLFTYFLLKRLQETKGDVSLQELGNYVTEQVKRKSIVSNGKSQTPTIVPSAGIGDTWQNMKLK